MLARSLASRRAHATAFRSHPVGGAWDGPFVAIGPDGFAEGRRGAERVRYQVSQTIPFPGKRGARGAAASERTTSAEADVATLERQLTVVATQAFYRRLLAALLTLIVVPVLYLLYARRAVVGATPAGRETGAG